MINRRSARLAVPRLGNYSDTIGPGAIGRGEIADGEVRADELGAINQYVVVSGQVSSYSFVEKTVDCPAGERLISGGAFWDPALGTSADMAISESYRLDEDTWKVAGTNDSNHIGRLRGYAYCLA